MTYQQAGKQLSTQAIVLPPGAGRLLPGPEGLTLKATGRETNGSIGFIEATSEPGFAAPRHIHHEHDELFYILDGEFAFLLGEEEVRGAPGTFVFIPRGMVHSPKVIGPGAGKTLIVFVPGGAEQAFEEFAALKGSEGDPMQAMQEIARKYNSEFV